MSWKGGQKQNGAASRVLTAFNARNGKVYASHVLFLPDEGDHSTSNVAINLWAVHVRISSWCDCKPLLPWPPKYMHAGPNCVSRSLNQVRTLFLLVKRLGVLACQIKPGKLDFLFRISHLATRFACWRGVIIHYLLLVKTLAIYTQWHYSHKSGRVIAWKAVMTVEAAGFRESRRWCE